MRTRLELADSRLATAAAPWASAAPERSRAHGLTEIAELALAPGDDPALVDAFVDGLVGLAEAIHAAFPGNLLWDLDLPATTWLVRARASEQPARRCAELFGLAIDLQHAFGRTGALHFRYVHDFTYGYDWAKWVARAPGERAGIGPFDDVFLRAMAERGRELVGIIAAGGDPKYPPLPDHVDRNPFPFAREPEGELALHRELARLDQLPLHTWRSTDAPRWDRPYAAWREAAAARLGLGHAAALDGP